MLYSEEIKELLLECKTLKLDSEIIRKTKYNKDISIKLSANIKLSDLIEEKQGTELKLLAKIKEYCVGEHPMERGHYYKQFIDLIIDRITKKYGEENLAQGIMDYLKDNYEKHIMIVRYRIVWDLINYPHYPDSNENVIKHIESNLEYLCSQIMEGHPEIVWNEFEFNKG